MFSLNLLPHPGNGKELFFLRKNAEILKNEEKG